MKKPLTTWAQLRFSIIGALLARPPSNLGKAFERLAGKRYRHPTQDRWVTFGTSTIERWYYRALNSDDPYRALVRKVRSDLGRSYAMSPQLVDALKSQYGHYPHWSYQLHADNLVALIEQQPELGNAPSYATVFRRMKERGWLKHARDDTARKQRARKRREGWEVRSYESAHVHALWHLDFHKGRRVVDVHGNWHGPEALCMLDDRSRLCCHMQWYLNETAENLVHGLTQAFHKRGLPRSLMTDNGSAMIAHETVSGLRRLAIEHSKTLAYSAYQNGKQESFWGQVEGRLFPMLSRVKPLTLSFLNRCTQAWVELEYNRRIHDEIKSTPLERMLEGPDVSRPSPDSETVKQAFTVLESRVQRRSDGTIQLRGVRFEIPSRFRHFTRVHVRYQSWDLAMAYLVDARTEDVLAHIYPQDKTKNASGYRRCVLPEPKAVASDSDPLPPLMRKILQDYAATGLPPAYLPKEEVNE